MIAPNKTPKRPTLGLLTHGARDPNNRIVWSGVADVARENAVNLICFPGKSLRSEYEFEAQANIIYDLVDLQVLDGIVVWLAGLSLWVGSDEIRAFCESFQPLPLVTVGTLLKGTPGVLVDNYHGMRRVVNHIIEAHDRSRVVFIRGPERHQEAEERFQAYLDALAEHGIPLDPELVVLGNFKEGSGGTAIEELLDHREARFDAIVAASDNMAIGAMKTLQSRGIRVPVEVAVAGLNDEAQSRYITPPLTTSPLHFYEQGRRATEMVLALMRGEQVPEQVVIPTRLLTRQSCGCPAPSVVHAGIEPQVQKRQAFLGNQVKQREWILAETFESLELLPANQASGFAEQMIDVFMDEVEGKSSGEFLALLTEGVRRAVLLEEDSSRWQEAVTNLRRCVLSCISTPEHLQRAEMLINQSRVLIGEIVERGQAYQTLQVEEKLQIISEINQGLGITTSVEELADALSQALRLLKIPLGYLSLYEDPQLPAGWSRLIVAYDQRGLIQIVPGGQRFPSRQLAPEGYLPGGEPLSLVVEPLHFREDQLGFMVLAADPCEDETYEILRHQISAALKRNILAERNVRLYEEAVEARKEAEYANLLKSRFLTTVSHELRTPLSLIVGTIEMMLQEEKTNCVPPLPEIYRQDMDCVEASARHLFRLIGDVLDLASSQAGELRLACEPLPLGKILQEAALLGETMAREKFLSWRAEFPKYMPFVWGDRTRLRQVTLNLISNAVKFTERGEITLQAVVNPKTVTVLVSDTGMGIPEEEQGTIFNEFRRSERSLERGYGGMGLGLAISRRLIELHGGEIGVRSTGEDGAGSSFFYTLPLIEEQYLEEEEVENRSHTVLLMVEQAERAQLLHEHLSQHGFETEVLVVRENQDWLAQVMVSPPGAVVLDFQPAAEKGWELINLLKQDPSTRDIPVVFYSLSEEGTRGAILEMDYLIKPLGGAELARVLERLGLGSDENPLTILVVDDEIRILEMHTRMLECELPNCRVLKAHNGHEALQIIDRLQPDLVLLDLMMPVMDGFEVLKVMRDREITRDIPVIVLTAQTLTAQDMERLQQGVAAVLGKGLFSGAEVMAQVEAALARNKRLGSEAQRIVRRAIAYVNEHYMEPISRMELANHLSVSENHLTRCFRQEMGITPIAYLNRLRIKQARALLERGEESIMEIAQQVGFSDSNYFGRVFRKEVGVTPGAYLHGKRADGC